MDSLEGIRTDWASCVMHLFLVKKEASLKNGTQKNEVIIPVLHRVHCDCWREDGLR